MFKAGRIVISLAACLLLFAPAARALAVGDGIRQGPTLIFPTLSVTETYDDNIGLSSGNTQSDWVTSVAPTVRLVLPVQRFFLEGEGGLDFRRYIDNDDENSTNWFLGAAVGADFPGGLSFKIGDRQTARYLIGSQEYGPGEDSSLNSLRAMAAYSIRDVLRLEFTGLRTAYTYDRSLERERVESSLQAGVSWKFQPSLSAVFEAAYNGYAYDSNTAQDGSAVQLALGLTWNITAKSTGFAKAGFQMKQYADENAAAGIEGANYLTVSAGLRHFFTSRTLVQIDLSRASQESDFPENPYYLRTAVGASFSQRFTAKVYGRAGLRYSGDSYPNETTYANPYDATGTGLTVGKRSDGTLAGSLAVGFDVTRWLALEMEYGYDQRSSNFDTFDYNATRVSLSAKAAF